MACSGSTMGSARCMTMRPASCSWAPWPARRRAAMVSSTCIRATGSGRSWKRCSLTQATPPTTWALRCHPGARSRCATTSRYGMRSNPATFAMPAMRASAMWCRAIWRPSSPVRASTTSTRAGRKPPHCITAIASRIWPRKASPFPQPHCRRQAPPMPRPPSTT